MSGQVSRGSAGEYQADERQVWRGSAGEYFLPQLSSEACKG